MVLSVAAFSINRRSPDSAQMLFRGDLDAARKVVSDSLIFSESTILQERLKEVERAKTPQAVTSDAVLSGRITAFYPQGSFGFIIQDTTGQVFHFPAHKVATEFLKVQLADNRTGQKVLFTSSGMRGQGTKYPSVDSIDAIDDKAGKSEQNHTDVSGTEHKQPSSEVHIAALPKGASAYARAKREELKGILTTAETLFRQEISARGSFANSAIMDLAPE